MCLKKDNVFKRLINNRNSIFTKILIPTIAVMFFQVILISFSLSVNGTMQALESDAEQTLFRHAENRSITLENMMVYTWSNLDRLEAEVSVKMQNYLTEKNLSVDGLMASAFHKSEMLFLLSDPVLQTMQLTSTTGAFAFFIDENDLAADETTLQGLYLRDANPMMVSLDHSDILLERGSADVARSNNIPLSSLWSEKHIINKSGNLPSRDSLFLPYQAAVAHPSLSTKDLAFWSDTHYLEANPKLDSYRCITYTRPLFFDGHLIGVIGTEIQMDYLQKYFPARDIGDLGGYMLLRSQAADAENAESSFFVNATTGSYLKRLADFGDTLVLSQEDRITHHVQNKGAEKTSAAVQPLTLYNRHAPFSDRQWALAALLPDQALYRMPGKIQGDIFNSSLIAMVLGGLLILLCIRLATKPLLSIASQLRHGKVDEPVVIPNTKTNEIVLLCDTINEMKRKRKDVEVALREERERFLIALESAIDAFIEYDTEKEHLEIYFFTEQDQKREPASIVVPHFLSDAACDHICHPADVGSLREILYGRGFQPCEVRFSADIFPDGQYPQSDDGYHWFALSVVQILSEDGSLAKTIGSAKEITAMKLEQFAQLEASYHDVTTGAYSRAYGEILLEKQVGEVADCCMIALPVLNYDQLEAYYGRVFSAAMLRELGHELAMRFPDATLIRWHHNGFAMLCSAAYSHAVLSQIESIKHCVYAGENHELGLSLTAGIVPYDGTFKPSACVAKAFAAATYAEHTGQSCAAYAAETMSSLVSDAASRKEEAYTTIDISRDTIVGFTLDLFEHTTDIESVTTMLLRVLSKEFDFSEIIVCEYDSDFSANRVAYTWYQNANYPLSRTQKETTHADFAELSALLDDKGDLVYNSDAVPVYSENVKHLLCVDESASFSALCCSMYESSQHTGRIIFLSADRHRAFEDAEIFALSETTKIMSTLFNLARSNSVSKAKSEFLSKMSHEIRTPMNAIIGMTRIAKESMSDAQQTRACLDKIDFSAKHLLSLINDILDMSRIESGKMEIEKQPFLLTGLVHSVDTLMRPQFADKHIRFDILQDIPQTGVLGDEQKLLQVLINLLGNACKFTPPGGTVTFALTHQWLEATDEFACTFFVSDTGAGIPKEDQAKIFNAFEQSQLSNTVAGNPTGTGLGLAISSSLISAMGGRIELVSENGKGAKFFFTLRFPGADQAGSLPGSDAPDTDASAKRFDGKTMLLVDDNEMNLEIASYLAESMGFTVDLARNGQEAVEKFLSSKPGQYDVICMDISMPVMDGLTAAREIRKNRVHPAAKTIPIVAMTANAFTEDTKKSIQAGMNAHVAKPIDADFLYRTLKNLLLSKDTQPGETHHD